LLIVDPGPGEPVVRAMSLYDHPVCISGSG